MIRAAILETNAKESHEDHSIPFPAFVMHPVVVVKRDTTTAQMISAHNVLKSTAPISRLVIKIFSNDNFPKISSITTER